MMKEQASPNAAIGVATIQTTRKESPYARRTAWRTSGGCIFLSAVTCARAASPLAPANCVASMPWTRGSRFRSSEPKTVPPTVIPIEPDNVRTRPNVAVALQRGDRSQRVRFIELRVGRGSRCDRRRRNCTLKSKQWHWKEYTKTGENDKLRCT